MVDGWIWIPFTLMAAAMQTFRTAGQKRLSDDASTLMATFARFLFGLPLAVAYLSLLLWTGARGPPDLSLGFLSFSLLAAVSQILATFLLVHMFTLRNFAIGTTFAMTEVLLTAILGVLLFGEAIPAAGWGAIIVCVTGVMLITRVETEVHSGVLSSKLLSSSTGVGLASGLGFAFASLSVRRASLSLGDPDYLVTAAFTLVAVLSWEVLLLGAFTLIRERHQYALVKGRLRLAVFVGITSMLGSVGWFTAMTLENASYVKALGQVELLFGLIVSTSLFKERYQAKEYIGMALIVAGILLLLFLA